jgi:hypothetical protein
MSSNKKPFEPHGVLIAYKELGTISIDEFIHAFIEDMQALKDIYNVHYVTAPRLKIIATNEYGEQIRVRRPAGGYVYYMDTHHYRPVCRDYDL